MGQAKQRGTYEQRKAQAMAAKKQHEAEQQEERERQESKCIKRVNVGTIGHSGIGKATLMASIAAGLLGAQAVYVNRAEEATNEPN